MKSALLLNFLISIAVACIIERINPVPKNMISYKLNNQNITIDGKLDEPAWQEIEFSPSFIDIEGDRRPHPRFDTKIKTRYDDQYFYVGAYMVEPHVCAVYRENHSPLYLENDFEIFFDPSGKVHQYTEFEINAINTIWTLLMINPYRDSRNFVSPYSMPGMKTAVWVDGTVNDPSDIDRGWSVEVAFSWNDFHFADMMLPPRSGDIWRMNFMRVQWKWDVVNGSYVKAPGREDNWVWSQQGAIAMHLPEMYGFVQFSSDEVNTTIFEYPILKMDAQLALWRIYEKQKEYFKTNGSYAMNYQGLGLEKHCLLNLNPNLVLGTVRKDEVCGFVATVVIKDDVYHVRNDSKQWTGKTQLMKRDEFSLYYLLGLGILAISSFGVNIVLIVVIIVISWLWFRKPSPQTARYDEIN